MNTRPLTPFFWSAALHAAIAALIIGGFVALKPTALVLPRDGSDNVFQTLPDTSPVLPASPFNSPVLPSTAPAAAPAVPAVRFVPPTVVALRPAPVREETPPPVEPAVAAPVPSRTAPSAARPQARPPATAATSPVSSRPAPPAGAVRTPPRIDVDEILATPSASAAARSGAGPSRSGAPDGADDAPYVARFLAALRAAHASPDGVSGGLVARVSFRLTPGGGAADVRVEAPSGDTAFDRSVVAALANVRVPGAPATSVDKRLSVTFRASAER